MKGKTLYLLTAAAMVLNLTACGGQTESGESTSAASMASTEEAMQSNQEETVSAVYLGVQNYGAVEAENKDAFTYRFSLDGEEITVPVSNENNYAIQNQLMEGSRYELTMESIRSEAASSEETVVAAELSAAAAVGTVTAISDGAVSVDGVEYQLVDDVRICRIITAGGGASVETAELQIGDTVRLYGEPAAQIDICTAAEAYTAPVSYTPGERTLKNFLATAIQPVGTTLYVYGGGWDWQDEGSSVQSVTIGVPEAWKIFFAAQDENYTYKDESDEAHSYYPFHKWNEYYYAGADCSGYLGWTLYNVMNTQSGGEGFVAGSTGMARSLAQDRGYGTWTQEVNGSADFAPGDIFSMNGHVWICLGACEDGSLVILHSTPTDSRTGCPGGGVQLSGLGDSEDCQAVTLARQYMSRYYPEWSRRYEAAWKDFSVYTSFEGEKAGHFSWNLDESGLTDPDGYADLRADEILADLFGETA